MHVASFSALTELSFSRAREIELPEEGEEEEGARQREKESPRLDVQLQSHT